MVLSEKSKLLQDFGRQASASDKEAYTLLTSTKAKEAFRTKWDSEKLKNVKGKQSEVQKDILEYASLLICLDKNYLDIQICLD